MSPLLDYQPSNITTSLASVAAGGTMTVSLTMLNNGGAASVQTNTRLRLGDANFAASQSAPYAQGVQAAPPSLVGAPVISSDNPNGLFNAPGQPTPGVQRPNDQAIDFFSDGFVTSI